MPSLHLSKYHTAPSVLAALAPAGPVLALLLTACPAWPPAWHSSEPCRAERAESRRSSRTAGELAASRACREVRSSSSSGSGRRPATAGSRQGGPGCLPACAAWPTGTGTQADRPAGRLCRLGPYLVQALPAALLAGRRAPGPIKAMHLPSPTCAPRVRAGMSFALWCRTTPCSPCSTRRPRPRGAQASSPVPHDGGRRGRPAGLGKEVANAALLRAAPLH